MAWCTCRRVVLNTAADTGSALAWLRPRRFWTIAGMAQAQAVLAQAQTVLDQGSARWGPGLDHSWAQMHSKLIWYLGLSSLTLNRWYLNMIHVDISVIYSCVCNCNWCMYKIANVIRCSYVQARVIYHIYATPRCKTNQNERHTIHLAFEVSRGEMEYITVYGMKLNIIHNSHSTLLCTWV